MRIAADLGAASSRTAAAPINWTGFDAQVEQAAKSGIELLPFLVGAPTWAVPNANVPGAGGAKAPGPPAGDRHRGDRLDRLPQSGGRPLRHRRHLLDRTPAGPGVPINNWQIWNEPNFKYFVAKPNPTEYGQAGEALLGGDQIGRPDRAGRSSPGCSPSPPAAGT